jgi:signal transduction histidine kinase
MLVGLRARMLLLVLVPMTVALGAYGMIRLRQEEAELLTEERRRMALTATALQVAVENALRDRQIADIQRLLEEIVQFQEEIDRIRIFDAGLAPIVVSNPLAIGEDIRTADLRRAMETRQPVLFFRRQAGRRALYTLVPLRGPGDTVRGAMEIVRLAGGIDAKVAAARLEMVQRIGVLAAILGALLWVGLRQSVVMPIRRLMGGVRALAAGRPEPIPSRGHDELAELARAFNEMAVRLATTHRQLVAETETRLDLAGQVRQAEQLVVAGRIASEVAHEIGTPLNIISGRTELLLGEAGGDDGRGAHLGTILAQVDRIRGILTALLDVVRPRKAVIEVVRLEPLLGSVVELLRPTARARGLTLAAEIAAGSRVLADPNQLQQVVINLLMNALEATPAGGSVELRARQASRPGGEPGAELLVIDSGTGIPAEHLERVFDPFFTTKPPGQGTGLGLAICRDIVVQHAGSIEADSRPRGGTTIRVWLPAPGETER